MARIVFVQLCDTEKEGAVFQEKFVAEDRAALLLAIDNWLSTVAEPALDAAPVVSSTTFK
ncbi:hypothetical protein LCGC14_1335510 [marine sediment metagenome]|uniref:Uncharacterized protein n=1 Tax=marine sediment metagenome TaxID=412755 RepID=A0A0F9KG13_9ZZZZ